MYVQIRCIEPEYLKSPVIQHARTRVLQNVIWLRYVVPYTEFEDFYFNKVITYP